MPSLRACAICCSAAPSASAAPAQASIGSTNAGGTGSPSAAIRARLAALEPTSSSGHVCLRPSPIRRIFMVLDPSSREVHHHMLAEEMTDASKAVGRPLDCARKLKDADTTVCASLAQHKGGDAALGIVSRVLDVDQPTRSFECVIYIGASTLGHFGCGVYAGGCGFGLLDDRVCQFGERCEKFLIDDGGRQGGHKGRLLQLVDGLLRRVD